MATEFGIHGKTLRAFSLVPIRVGEVDIHPACMAHVMAMRAVCKSFETDQITPEEMLSAIVVFSTPPAEASALLTRTLDDWEAARRAISSKVMLGDLAAYAEAIRRQISDALAPAIPAKGDGSKKKAASVGGSSASKARAPRTATPRR